MKPIEAVMLTLISHMPLIDRLEAVAVTGRSRGAVYGAFDALERDGLAASVPHASELIRSTRRYFPTADGLRKDRGGRENPGGRPAPQPSRIGAVAARPGGAPRRRCRHIQAGLRHIGHRAPHPLPLVQGVAHGRRDSAPERARDRRRQAGNGHRPHRLLQEAVAAQAGGASGRRAHAHARRGAAQARAQAGRGRSRNLLPRA